MGHMRQALGGTRSSTTTTNHGRPVGALRKLKLEAAADDAMAMPEQEVGNVKTKKVFMTVKLFCRHTSIYFHTKKTLFR